MSLQDQGNRYVVWRDDTSGEWFARWCHPTAIDADDIDCTDMDDAAFEALISTPKAGGPDGSIKP